MAKYHTLQSANVDSSADVDPIVAAPGTGKKIRVHSYQLIGAGAVVSVFKSGTAAAGTALATVNHTAAGIGAAESVQRPDYLFECADNEALSLDLSAAARVTGRVSYTTVPSNAAD